ncbi:D-alanyl-D-alanine carboxypeptidase/D-alanyl-D-alanine endopeptidase [Rubrivivax gelatinosus]|uniref:D-alanyl-D-alanine carboxypeptidase/D-alanyl-D-alanine-endopeptidase (Penicillin-binding protein 4) n=1 Tax=Rubrivivax gelatinosus TaxID=28068 RepID=A0A4R2ML66_RUBGE|nr:D-alanyl-D-alanine carboxypeptidase/D-alanyl-D-alanine-endopeptidase [Rubrivivax gelatinosus]MBK1688280.1 D-alanyl-D-alanine carboxypeptidase/D-alanyl-D-alanine-endopeptidase [Rubrivivax gelatinosus]TCP05554.1 D-alanyl-D-alanine carboxypeptidase/D-alanyl-D-alanine-endopeptidase (penicillin-binding protein 4) [Rubrivivax gelatinosus]
MTLPRALACTALVIAALGARAQALPAEARAALERAGVPASALAVVVRELPSGGTRLAWQPELPLNPASVTKLVTTLAALERLGTGWTWTTPVWLQGEIRDGVLEGSLVLQGRGDPQLSAERLRAALRRVRQMGVQEIRGDIVIDGSAFVAAETAPGDFDGEATRPYNVQPAALMASFRSVGYTFVPDPAAGVARVLADPPLARTAVQPTVPLGAGPCSDWRTTLGASFGPAVRFGGRYPAACGELAWYVADPDPASYDTRLLEALWAEAGGRLGGRARAGLAPRDLAPSFELRSPPLADLLRDMNKLSQNTMAEQITRTLALQRRPDLAADAAGARAALAEWLDQALGPLPPGTVIDNGSGLSRTTRLSAGLLARLLERGFASPAMPEFVASLPVAGIDGTMRRARALTPGRAHLKTGSLRDVAALAGYVFSDSGRRYAFVALLQHPNAAAARPAFEALLQWTARDAPPLATP